MCTYSICICVQAKSYDDDNDEGNEDQACVHSDHSGLDVDLYTDIKKAPGEVDCMDRRSMTDWKEIINTRSIFLDPFYYSLVDR